MRGYSVGHLLTNAFSGNRRWGPAWKDGVSRDQYDVVIVGGGGHGLATAYYLAKKHNIKKIAVLEKGWLGGGNTGRNTCAIRSNYFSKEATDFYEHSLSLYEGLSKELNFNIMFSQRGVITLAHSEREMEGIRRWANAIQINGTDSRFLTLAEIRKRLPILDTRSTARFPVVGGFVQERGGIARHDAVAWAYARAASHLGVDIIQGCEVKGIDVTNGVVTGVHTNIGFIGAEKVAAAVAGHTSQLAAMAGVSVPIRSMTLQAMVTEPLQAFFDAVVISSAAHVYVSQSDRGELVIGGSADGYNSFAQRGSFSTVEENVTALLNLYPTLSRVKLMRHWGGIVDITPDISPIVSRTPVAGYYLSGGWGTGGFKAIPAGGDTLAYLIANDASHSLTRAFSLDRFRSCALVDELAAGGVGH